MEQVKSDPELVRLIARGDREALRLLYERHREFVYRVALRFLDDEEDAGDVTQAVFLNLIHGARHFRSRARFTTWLYRVTANRCLNLKDRAYRRLRADGVDPAGANGLAEDPASRPDAILEFRELETRIRLALARLSSRQRLALILSRYEGLSYKEIARAMECSVGSVESLLYRARQSLLEAL